MSRPKLSKSLEIELHYLFELNHPKHYHQFKNIFKAISANNDSFEVIARNKDVLLFLLNEDNVPYHIYGKRGNSLFNKLLFIPRLLIDYFRKVKAISPDVIVSKASPYAAIIGKLMNIPTVITPDSEIVYLTNKFVAPISSLVITQNSFNKKFGVKHKTITGFFETTYLHPAYFHPQEDELLTIKLKKDEKYFVVRFIGWDANHDINQFGFSNEEKIKLVNFLEKYGRVIITSEKNVPHDLQKNVFKLHPSKIHHLLSYADLYIGDSQSMATEAALLGTPSIRYNSFVGENDMSNFKLLQEKYDLLINCRSFEEVIAATNKILNNSNSKKEWQKKAEKYFDEIGDTNDELLQLINSVINKK